MYAARRATLSFGLSDAFHRSSPVFSSALVLQSYNVPFSPPVRFYKMKTNTKHWNPKWKKLRALKVMPVELPDFNEKDDSSNLTSEEIRSKMKEKGIHPPRPWMERQFEISATGDAFDPYVPPEGDGKATIVSKEGAKQTAEMVSKKSKTWMAIRKIRAFDEDFKPSEFAEEAQQIYLKVFELIAAQDKHGLRSVVTEKAYPEVTLNMYNRTSRWKFLESIEPPRVVHVRCTDVITKENIFAQVTCRFHTKQSLAVYDRFGRLAYGSEVIAKDVLEYVVFEKHLANQYGIWRVHTKLIPPWAPKPEEMSSRTLKL